MTALHMACQKGHHLTFIKVLLQYGANIYDKTYVSMMVVLLL